MNTRQQLFAQYYVETTNATESAKRAGYSDKTAEVTGSRLLSNAKVKSEIKRLTEELAKPSIATADEVLQYLTSVLRCEETEQVLRVSSSGAQTIIEKEPAIKDRNKAAELLGKRYGILTDKLDINGAVPVVIANDDSLED